MKKILVLILAILLLAGCTTKNEEKKEEKEKVETTIKYNKNISSNKIEKCDYKPELLFEKDGIKIYSYCINDITYNKNKLSKDNFNEFIIEVKSIEDSKKVSFDDGGTVLYKGEEMNVLVCNSLLDFALTNQDVYIGDNNMTFKGNFCKEDNTTKVITLKVADIKGDEVTLSRDNEMDSVVFPYDYKLEKGKTYDFEFMIGEDLIVKDTIKDMFEMATLVDVREHK